MQIGPLSLFTRRHSNGTPINAWTLAALHWKWSITWRWILVLDFRYGPRLVYVWGRLPYMVVHVWPLTLQLQENMPKRARGGGDA